MLRKSIARDLLLILLFVATVCMAANVDSVRVAEPVRARIVPTMRYVMASPRAALVGRPAWSANTYYLPSGAADNFAREAGSIRVRVGSRVNFCLSNQTEGVWYSNSYGTLGTSLTLQWCAACNCEDTEWKDCINALCDCDACICAASGDCELDETVTAEAEDICPWVTIGRDGAKATRKGPSIGHASVGVPVRFRKAGIYYLRGIVSTVARPWYPLPIDQWTYLLPENSAADSLPAIPIASDKDVVYVRVHVIDLNTADVEPVEEVSTDPDVEYIEAMPVEEESNQPAEAELSGDELIVEDAADTVCETPQQDRQQDQDQTQDQEGDGVMIRDRDQVSKPLRGDAR